MHSSGGWYFYSWNSAGSRWIDTRRSVVNPPVQSWSSPPARWTNGYGMGSTGNWRMTGVQDSSYRWTPPGFYNGVSRLGYSISADMANLWNGFADGYNTQAQRNAAWMSDLKLPFTNKTLGETGFGQRLLSQVPQIPHWNMHGVAQALVPGITGWVDSGFAMPNSPLDMWKGQWKGGGNFLSHTVEGMINSGPLGKLVHLATGYRLDLPSFDIPAQQQMGAAAFDAGMITLSVVAPEARLPALNGAGRVANSAPKLSVPATRATNPLSPVLEFDAHGNELLYRTMSPTDFAKLQRTGKIPATGETFISPSQAYSSEYKGVLVRFAAKPGAMQQLADIGVTANPGTAILFPEMQRAAKGWTANNAMFKLEGNVVNAGLGRGNALTIFNQRIVRWERIH